MCGPHARGDVNLLSSTSALVLLWSDGRAHTSAPARRFLGMLDLSLGEGIMRECDQFWPHYPEVIRNRKSCVLDLALDCIENDGTRQVVILGAGMDALSIELCSRLDCMVFDVDSAGMGRKEQLVGPLARDLRGTLRCVTADASKRASVMSGLAGAGWSRDEPSLLVVEGLSYYLTAGDLWGLASGFSTAHRGNRMILEYLLPTSDIPEDLRPVASRPFDLIVKEAYESVIPLAAFPMPHHPPGLTAEDSLWAFTTRYGPGDVEARAAGLGGAVLSRHDMRSMEARRTGRSAVFGERSGWIEVCKIAPVTRGRRTRNL